MIETNERVIAKNPTAIDDASDRALLTEQLAGVQSQIEGLVDDLRRAGDSAGVAQGQSQLQFIRALQRRVEHSSGASLASLRAEITAAISAGQSVAQATASAEARSHSAEAIHAASEAAHREVGSFVHDFYDRKEFDPYLRFSSVQDEEEYRKREAEHRAAIEKALAEGTPEGDLRATRLSMEQMKDAGAHGADRSPDYAPQLKRVTDSAGQLAAALSASPSQQSNPAVDPADNAPPAPVPPNILAALKASGMTGGARDGNGHGLATSIPPSQGTGRTA